MQTLPPGVRATIVPGKTYEYLASETPILGAVPEGDARDILEEAGNAVLVRPDDVDGIASALERRLEAFRAARSRAPRPTRASSRASSTAASRTSSRASSTRCSSVAS